MLVPVERKAEHQL